MDTIYLRFEPDGPFREIDETTFALNAYIPLVKAYQKTFHLLPSSVCYMHDVAMWAMRRISELEQENSPRDDPVMVRFTLDEMRWLRAYANEINPHHTTATDHSLLAFIRMRLNFLDAEVARLSGPKVEPPPTPSNPKSVADVINERIDELTRRVTSLEASRTATVNGLAFLNGSLSKSFNDSYPEKDNAPANPRPPVES